MNILYVFNSYNLGFFGIVRNFQQSNLGISAVVKLLMFQQKAPVYGRDSARLPELPCTLRLWCSPFSGGIAPCVLI